MKPKRDKSYTLLKTKTEVARYLFSIDAKNRDTRMILAGMRPASMKLARQTAAKVWLIFDSRGEDYRNERTENAYWSVIAAADDLDDNDLALFAESEIIGNAESLAKRLHREGWEE